jgi:hypothetical protein
MEDEQYDICSYCWNSLLRDWREKDGSKISREYHLACARRPGLAR